MQIAPEGTPSTEAITTATTPTAARDRRDRLGELLMVVSNPAQPDSKTA